MEFDERNVARDHKVEDMTTEYFGSIEFAWHASNKDWRQAETITAGIDVGSASSQAVVMIDSEIFAYSNLRLGADSPDSAREALNAALNGTGMTRDDIHYVVGTGCGEANISIAKKTVSEVSCHARGVNYSIGSSPRTILVMGGQDCTAMYCDERGKVIAFMMNGYRPVNCSEIPCFMCGAAQGRGMEVMANLLAVPVEEIAAISLSVNDELLQERLVRPQEEGGTLPLRYAISSVCAVLAQSHATWLLSQGWTKEDILAAYCVAMAHQGVFLLERVGVINDLAITGGVARNLGVVQRLEKVLGIKATIPEPSPQLTGALGGALFARAFLERDSGKLRRSLNRKDEIP